MSEVALGVKVFTRTERLSNLLDSLEGTLIDTVYVADDGETDSRRELYDRDSSYELVLLDLPYDTGIGAGRAEIVSRAEEPFIYFLDSDHEFPHDGSVLLDQLRERPELGGVAGSVVEPEEGRVWQCASDLTDEGDVLIRSPALNEKRAAMVAGAPLFTFDFVPNAAVFRRNCLEEYCWDPEYINSGEHLDFYVGHWKRTDWSFGICPSVMFPHYPGGDTRYMNERWNQTKRRSSSEYFLEKWGYRQVVTKGYWFDTKWDMCPGSGSPLARVEDVYREAGLGGVIRGVVNRARNSIRTGINRRR